MVGRLEPGLGHHRHDPATPISPASVAPRRPAGHPVHRRRRRGDPHPSLVDDPRAKLSLDTGFIFYNDLNYPTFIGLLAKLGVENRGQAVAEATRRGLL